MAAGDLATTRRVERRALSSPRLVSRWKQLLAERLHRRDHRRRGPRPAAGPRPLLVATRFSVISAGTERAAWRSGAPRWSARRAPAGPGAAGGRVGTRRRASPRPTRRSAAAWASPTRWATASAGVVLEACEDAPAAPGELVACAGAGHASHAEVVAVPRNLVRPRARRACAAEDAAYATIASIALHGVRLAGVRLGDVAAVVGLGLVGQLTLELLRGSRLRRARRGPRPAPGRARARGRLLRHHRPGELEAEAARLTAGAAPTACWSPPRRRAPRRSRPRRPSRGSARWSASSATWRSSRRARRCSPRSCGSWSRARTAPAATTPHTRSDGVDYPAGYVRWTEGRNLEEVLRLMAAGQLRPARLTTHTFDLERRRGGLRAARRAGEPSLGILLRYPGRADAGRAR